jgi:hypothetical protein
MFVSAQPFAEIKLISQASSAFRQTAPALPPNNRQLDSRSIVKTQSPYSNVGAIFEQRSAQQGVIQS